MNPTQLDDLRRAVRLLERPSLGARIASYVGTPVERAIDMLPAKARETIGNATHKAIRAALRVAIKSLRQDGSTPRASSDWRHMIAAAAAGAGGGAFGLPALAIELPVSTTIIMRSIADVARSEGADLDDVQTQLECVQVLAMGGAARSDDASEIGYFLARDAFARAIGAATAHIAKKGFDLHGAPVLVKLIVKIAERYSIAVTQKAAAQLLPVAGAIGGAAINTIFIDHFQDVARGHFIVRRLERELGADTVRARYLALAQSLQDESRASRPA